jgi:hypothetical protein
VLQPPARSMVVVLVLVVKLGIASRGELPRALAS